MGAGALDHHRGTKHAVTEGASIMSATPGEWGMGCRHNPRMDTGSQSSTDLEQASVTTARNPTMLQVPRQALQLDVVGNGNLEGQRRGVGGG